MLPGCIAIAAVATLQAMRQPISCHMLADVGYRLLPMRQAAWTAAAVTAASVSQGRLLGSSGSCMAQSRCMRRPASLRALRRPSYMAQGIAPRGRSMRDCAATLNTS